MLIRISNEIFEDARVSDPIIHLLELSKAGRFYLSAEDEASAEFLAWLARQQQETQVGWRIMADWSDLDQASYRMQSVIVVAGDTDDWKSDPPRLSLRTASALGARTFDIVVENQRNDRAFLLAFAGESKGLLQGLEAANTIRFAGAGGITEMKPIIGDQYSKRVDRKLKVFALFDSDGERPGHLSKQAEATQAETMKHGISFHCLERRAIENYLPLPAVFDFAGRRPSRPQRLALLEIADAFKSLNAEQKAHFPMKNGLPKIPTEAQAELYADVHSDRRATLVKGFTDNLAEMYGEVHEPKLSGQIEADGAKDEVRRAIQAILFFTRAPV